jgi:hypothetical protein
MMTPRRYRTPAFKLRALLILAVLGVSPISLQQVFCQEPLPTTGTLEVLVSKWVDLRRQIVLEQQGWNEQKAHLERERGLLLREKQLLETEIAEKKKAQALQQRERAELLQKREAYEKALEDALPALDAAEANLKLWRGRIPPSLLSGPEKLFAKLADTSSRSFSQRLQVILGLYAEVERLEYRVHVVKEVLRTYSGSEQEFDVVYVGLAQGYCVSSDGKRAGVGRPAEKGWDWRWIPEIAPEVRKGIEFYRHEKIADFVHLPLKVAQ